ncbi:bacteriophage holin [Halosolutus halophilus]|uniref:bacteriophage holin n=1 Tax=Halosolutus halophilus TaxID=1552990 RepID=UPI00223506C6|nr:bacteriophage holin [Halosolutus halophilus]
MSNWIGTKVQQSDSETMQEPRRTTISEPSRLEPNAFGLACGIFWAGAVAAIGLTARVGWGKRWEELLADMYRGFNETRSGLIIGAGWAFLDGFTSGYVVASLYDRILPD